MRIDNIPPRPGDFAREVDRNRRGAPSLSELPPLAALTASEVVRLQKEGAVAVDTRPVMQFAVAHLPASVHIALAGHYTSWVVRILGLGTRLIIAGEDPEHVIESWVRLARVGVRNVVGYLRDCMADLINGGFELDYIPQITVEDLVELQQQKPDRITLLDVREPVEWSAGVIENSVRIPLGELQSRTGELDRERRLVVHCRSGYRSSIATSLLQRAGFCDIANLTGGIDSWKKAGFPYSVPDQ